MLDLVFFSMLLFGGVLLVGLSANEMLRKRPKKKTKLRLVRKK